MRSLSLLLHHVMTLKFIPIAEREVEGPHSWIHRFEMGKRSGPVMVSWAARGHDIAGVCQDQEDLDEMAKIVFEAKKIRNLPGMLQLGGQPWIRAAERSMGQDAWASLLAKVIYRGDNIDASETFVSARKHNEDATRKRKSAGDTTVDPTKLAFSQGYVASTLAAEHFKKGAQDKCHILATSGRLWNPWCICETLASPHQWGGPWYPGLQILRKMTWSKTTMHCAQWNLQRHRQQVLSR